MFQKVGVYCASRFDPQQKYLESFNLLADELIANQLDVLYGGANVGYMKVLADRIAPSPVQLMGVMPRFLREKELMYPNCDRFIDVESMSERIETIMNEADGFIVMPGGVGTFEELMDMMSWVQLGIHHKPIGIINVLGYYDGLQAQIEKGISEEFIAPSLSSQIMFSDNIKEVLNWMATQSDIEYWDIFDKNQQQLAITHPRGIPMQEGHFHRVNATILVNEMNQLLIQHRAPHVAHGDLWDYSAGGSVLAGESRLAGAMREVKEEIGLDLAISENHLLMTIKHRNMFMDVYLVKVSNINEFDFTISNEVANVKWVSLDDISQMIDDKNFKHGYLQKTILEKLYEVIS